MKRLDSLSITNLWAIHYDSNIDKSDLSLENSCVQRLDLCLTNILRLQVLHALLANLVSIKKTLA
jgi:hypothetical protein